MLSSDSICFIEQEIIGNVLLNPSLLDQVGTLAPLCFEDLRNRTIWEEIRRLQDRGESVSLSLLHYRLSEGGGLELVGGLCYLLECTEKAITSANIEGNARLLRKRGDLRALVRVIEETREACSTCGADSEEIIGKLKDTILGIQSSGSIKSSRSLLETLKIGYADIQGRQSGDKPGGHQTGYERLDRLVCFRPAELVVLAGRPSMGKTALATNIALNIAKAGVSIGLISLEMFARDIGLRILSAESHIPLSILQGRQPMSEGRWQKLSEAVGKIEGAPFYIADECPARVEAVVAEIHRQVSDHACQVVIVDYLQLIQPERIASNQNQWVAFVSQRLKTTAKELGITVICLSQLSRGVEDRGGDFRPRLSDLRDSGAIEQDADVVMFVYRPEVYEDQLTRKKIKFNIGDRKVEKDFKGLAEIIVAKNRNGGTGSVWLQWTPEMTQFNNLAINV
jgi:replicative DNA helicase